MSGPVGGAKSTMEMEGIWTGVERYVSDLLVPHDEALEAALRASEDAGLPAIQVSPPQGKLLQLLAQMVGARNALEVGTLGGYSTIWLARGLVPGGRLVTLELEPRYAEVALRNLERARLDEIVEVRVGPALETLERMDLEGEGPFDFTFIDADKARTPDYFVWALEHSHPGSLIVVDNVVRGGSLIDREDDDPSARGQRQLHELLATEPGVSATTIQTVGGKGYDGFTLVLVLEV